MAFSRSAACLIAGAACLFAGAALLAACSKPASNQPAASASSASSGPDVVITEADLPHLKPGLWETTVTTSQGGPPETSRHCESGESVKPAAMAKNCSSFVFKRTFLGGIVIDAACGANGVFSTMHMSMHGDFSGGFSGDSQVSLTLPGQPTHTFTTHSEAHYVGACPAGEGADG
jgi:hypothetical protein